MSRNYTSELNKMDHRRHKITVKIPFLLRENPDRTFNWFFEATCPITKEKGEAFKYKHLGVPDG